MWGPETKPCFTFSISSTAAVFWNQGKYGEAIQQYQRELAGYKKALGKNHSLRLNTVNNIAIVFDKQGKYDEVMQ
ncbi:hypothetical protein AOL_s00076g235 [Orbilia oligospora ATCC 24927]|uniref:Kinesin light chain n=1 Tax=Arthrobotrys oligospora (strain ATCC 24927 / CBS 115.81 / DSM 1491) TaxID=756982 RepID=G1X9C8_ARTOA|nr:hypothetical protein AOL_s00076g235 [Orbilia oligospora ATCC 24927]EGX50160.1 hypothetical protein AOL_s00076g235 [Orbilia oligospora ATCC 24927]